MIHQFCHHCCTLQGDFAECGVYKAGTAFLIAHTLNGHSIEDKQLHLFDTFAGMSSIANQDESSHREGDFADVSLEAISNYLEMFPFVVCRPGFIPETFEAVEDRQFAFCHIDVDIYGATKDCCSCFYDRLVSGAVMIFDDYGFPGYRLSAKRAVDEFFAQKVERPISLRTGQCIVIKL